MSVKLLFTLCIGAVFTFGSLGYVCSAQAYNKVAIVAKSGGDYTDPIAAMTDIATWCGTPSESNRCLVKIMAGVYDLNGGLLSLKPFTELAGSGEVATKLIDGTINGWWLSSSTDVIALRDLTIEGSPNPVNFQSWRGTVNISNVTVESPGWGILAGTFVFMNNVTVNISGTSPYNSPLGIWLQGSSEATLNNVNINVDASSSGSVGYTAGLYVSQAAKVTVKNSSIYSSTNSSNSQFGAYIATVPAQSPGPEITLSNVTISADGIASTTGIRFKPNNGSLALIDTIINVPATGAIAIEDNSTGSSSIEIDHSSLAGASNSILNTTSKTISIATSKIDGLITSDQSTIFNCYSNYDATYSAFTCP